MDTSMLLSRLQFGFTIAYHYLFPQFTMGLALLLVILKTLYLWRKDERFNASTHFWGRIFAITFVIGVVTGIPMEFQFGTNWARFSAYAGDIIAQTLAMEGAFAFFLESAFLGIFLFGERLGQKIHWFATVMVWLGTWASGGFIIASNAWMQHPVGYAVVGNKLYLAIYWAVLFNPWIIPQYMHTMSAAVVTGSFVMSGLGAFYILAKKYLNYARIFVTVGIVMGLLASIFQLYPSGDLEGQQVAQHQLPKLAAMEGLFETRQAAELVILGQPNVVTGQLDNAIIIPGVLSFLSYHRWTATVKGLNDFPPDQRPDSIELLYYSYHIMVGLGTFFIAIMSLAALFLFWGKRLYTMRWLLWLLLLAMPFPFIATIAGWFTTELGRQPWIAYGLLRTVDGSSVHLSAGNVLFTLIGYMGMYLLLGLIYILLMAGLMLQGPQSNSMPKEAAEEDKNDVQGLLGQGTEG